MPITRRRFTRVVLLGGLATSTASAAAVGLRFLWPLNATRPHSVRISAKDRPTPVTDPVAFAIDGRKAYVVAGEDEHSGFVAFLRKCPRGCTVAWRPQGAFSDGRRSDPAFICPCCGSVFDRHGVFQFGPAGRDLARLDVDFESDGDLRISFPPSLLATLR